jgi:transcriptional regulator with GAF, ATPase, and Fis domain
MSYPLSPEELAQRFADISERLATDADAPDGNRVLNDLVQVAVEMVDGADHAGVTVGRTSGRFETVAASSQLVHTCDEIQYDLGFGPCVDAVVECAVFNAADLRTDQRWPEFGRRAVEQTGIVSMLSMRLFIEADGQIVAGLNMYAHQPSAFDQNSEATAQLLAIHGALAVGKAAAQAKARHLDRALKTSREIGMAMGILMAVHKVTRQQAFDLLRMASQRSHRKLADIAAEVADTGTLPEAFGAQR